MSTQLTPAKNVQVPAPPEIIPVTGHRVWCDGGGGALGHPRVYLEIGPAGYVECGYCDRRFVAQSHDAHEDERSIRNGAER